MAEIPIFGTIINKTDDGKAAHASQIWDNEQSKFQSQINTETKNEVSALQGKINELVIPKIIQMTQAEYNALDKIDADTYYMCTEE